MSELDNYICYFHRKKLIDKFSVTFSIRAPKKEPKIGHRKYKYEYINGIQIILIFSAFYQAANIPTHQFRYIQKVILTCLRGMFGAVAATKETVFQRPVQYITGQWRENVCYQLRHMEIKSFHFISKLVKNMKISNYCIG